MAETANEASAKRPRIRDVLFRGLRRKCPRCGKGALFRRWIEFETRCSVCNLLYQRNHGDIWMFVIIMDRIPLMIGVAAVFFGFRSTTSLTAAIFFVLLVVPLIGTMPQRQGLALAMDYLSRVYFPDDSDEIHRVRNT